MVQATPYRVRVVTDSNSPISNAQLEWDEQGQPTSTIFGDIYFSSASGLEETRHVFLNHNQLPERFAALAENTFFTIGETGFGSGLNFLAASYLWLTTAPESAQLHFVSVEKFPLNKTDLIRALALWPALNYLSTPLIDNYPAVTGPAIHRLHFFDGRIKLTLIIDDAAIGFTKLLATTHPLFERSGVKIDAWFLDGFSPAKNPQMWSDELFNVIAKLSHSTTTATTFSAAAIVKNGLKRVGFNIQKVSGFGQKREMVKAIFTGKEKCLNANDFTFRGSFSPYPIPWTIHANKPELNQRHAVIIGGGLAGCHSARALAERGWQVTLIERNKDLAQEGSGNLQGVLYAKLSSLDEPQAAFNLAALHYALNHYQQKWPTIGSQCGVLQLAHKPAEVELQTLLRERFLQATELVEFVSAKRASDIAGVSITDSGLYFPNAGWINPHKLCKQLTEHSNIRVIYETPISQIKQIDSGWQVITENDNRIIAEAPIVIIATAKDALNFSQANHLPLKSIRGQVTYLPEKKGGLPKTTEGLPETKEGLKLNTVVCSEGYICPATENSYSIGATFNLKNNNVKIDTSDHDTNFNNLLKSLPSFAKTWQNIDVTKVQGRVGFRCTLPDYLPVVGPLPMVDEMIRDFAPLRKNAKAGITSPGSYHPGLYINIGHGARGLAYTPLCAELLASQINNEILPISQELANALNPARFLIRQLIKNKRD
jgi:tRNA 5-methylaminomethyl-2-thiouridine biosynthesis bifunctional protein